MTLGFLALGSIVLSVSAQFVMKVGMTNAPVKHALGGQIGWLGLLQMFCSPYVLLGFFFYGLSAVIWLKVLSAWEVSKAYPLVGLGFAMTVLVGFLTGESVTLQRTLGVMLICLGVWIVAKS